MISVLRAPIVHSRVVTKYAILIAPDMGIARIRHVYAMQHILAPGVKRSLILYQEIRLLIQKFAQKIVTAMDLVKAVCVCVIACMEALHVSHWPSSWFLSVLKTVLVMEPVSMELAHAILCGGGLIVHLKEDVLVPIPN